MPHGGHNMFPPAIVTGEPAPKPATEPATEPDPEPRADERARAAAPFDVERVRALVRGGKGEEARVVCEAFLADYGGRVDVHLAMAGVLRSLRRFDEALTHYAKAVALAPDDLELLNEFGKALRSVGRFDEARKVFAEIRARDGAHPGAGFSLSALERHFGEMETARDLLERVVGEHPYGLLRPIDPAKATVLRVRGFESSYYGIVRNPDGSFKSILRGGHFSLDNLMRNEPYNVVIFNLLENNINTTPDIPDFDVMINTIGCADRERSSLLALARYVDSHPDIAVINHPRRVIDTTRDRNYLRLNAVPGVRFPRTERVRWDGGSRQVVCDEILGLGFQYPIIIRQVGTQTGTSVALAKTRAELQAHFESSPPAAYYVIQFEEYSFRPGYYNKIRVFCLDGKYYPVVNLIDNTWHIHSSNRYSVMDKTPWTQEEEQRFLNNPVAYLGQANVEKLAAIRDMVGLDFFGIDMTVLQDGTLFIFELNPAMRHNYDHADSFPYTRPHLQRISKAFETMLEDRIRAGRARSARAADGTDAIDASTWQLPQVG